MTTREKKPDATFNFLLLFSVFVFLQCPTFIGSFRKYASIFWERISSNCVNGSKPDFNTQSKQQKENRVGIFIPVTLF